MLGPDRFRSVLPQLNRLPRWALVAIAARSSLREPQLIHGSSAYLFRPTDNPVLFQRLTLLDAVESAASAAKSPTSQVISESRAKWITLSKHMAPFALGVSGPQFGIDPEGSAGPAMAAAMLKDVNQAKEAAICAIGMSFAIARLAVTQQGILKDIEIATRASKLEHWTDDSPVPPHLFAVFADFDTESPIGTKTVLEIASPLNEKLVEFIARHPKHAVTMTPAAFEELVAELFRGFHFAVQLEARPGDGGMDVLAIQDGSKYIIQCKRFGTGKVEVGIVRELHGVVHDAPNVGSTGVVATTTWLTKPAREMIERNPLYLQAANYDRLVRWLIAYERSRFGSLPSPTLPD